MVTMSLRSNKNPNRKTIRMTERKIGRAIRLSVFANWYLERLGSLSSTETGREELQVFLMSTFSFEETFLGCKTLQEDLYYNRNRERTYNSKLSKTYDLRKGS